MSKMSQIKPNMPVVCSRNGDLGFVDHIEGTDMIRLAKDKTGNHHYFPLSWVRAVDIKVHIDRPGDQAMREWSSTAPTG